MDLSQLSIAVGLRTALALFWVGSMFAGGACNKPPPFPHRGDSVRANCPTIGEDDFFFPQESVFPADASRDDDRRLLLSNYLRTAGAMSLSCAGDDAYRVIWIGGYNEPVVIVTMDERAAIAIEFQPFNVAKSTIKTTHSKDLSTMQFQDIASEFESGGFWSADTVRVFESEGSSWTFEGRRDGSYRVLTRTHPEPALAKAGRLLVASSGLTLPARMSVPAK